MVSDSLLHFGGERRPPGICDYGGTASGFSPLHPAGLASHDSPKPIRLIIGPVVIAGMLHHGRSLHHVPRPRVAWPSEVVLGRLPLLLRGRRELHVLRLRWR